MHERWRLLAALPLGALTACPQLLNDEFWQQPGAGADSSAAGAGGELDASVTPRGNAGSGGSPSTAERDASSLGGAGGADTPPTPVQVALHAALAHRYRFDTNAPLLDSIGGANASAVGATVSEGAAVLSGTAGQYIDLPNGVLAGLHNASFEVWVVWQVSNLALASSQWQRIFDLGRNPTSVEGEQCVLDADATSIFLTPRTSAGKLQVTCESCLDNRVEATSLAVGSVVQLLAVLDDDANQLSLYRDGAPVGSGPFTGSISMITDCTGRAAPCDWNNWLGRSQHIEDPPFAGKILDFRIYSAALDATLVEASFAAGPDADW